MRNVNPGNVNTAMPQAPMQMPMGGGIGNPMQVSNFFFVKQDNCVNIIFFI